MGLTRARVVASGAGQPAPPSGSIAVSVAPSSVSVTQGSAATITLTVTRTTYTGTVTPSADSLPSGVSVSWSPASGTGTSFVGTLTATGSATVGTASYTFRVSGTGVTDATVSASVAVAASAAQSISVALSPSSVNVTQGSTNTVTATVTRNAGYTGTVTPSIGTLPSGVSIAWSPTSGTGTSFVGTVTATSGATLGSVSPVVAVAGSGVTTATATLGLTIFNPASAGVTLSIPASPFSVYDGRTNALSIFVTRNGGYTGALSLAATGLPSGLTVSSISGTSTGSLFTVRFVRSGAVSAATITITASGTGISNATATVSYVTDTTSLGSFTPNFPASVGLRLYVDTSQNEPYVANTQNSEGITVVDTTQANTQGIVGGGDGYTGNALQTNYAAGSVGGGTGGSQITGDQHQQWKRLYVSFDFYLSSNYIQNTGNEKLWYGNNRPVAGGALFGNSLLEIHGYDFGDGTFMFATQFTPAGVLSAVAPSTRPVKGAWNKVEMYQIMNTGSNADGTLALWINGASVYTKTDIQWSASGTADSFDWFKFDGTSGGGNSTVPVPTGGQYRQMGRVACFGSTT